MAEQTVTTVAPVQQVVPSILETVVVTPPTTEQPQVVQPPQEDLVSRVSKVKVDTQLKTDTNPFGLSKEDYDKVQQDPVLSKFYKSMHSDYIKKTQEASEIRKGAEDKIKQFSNWTPERIQQLLNDPQFVNAAQQVASTQNPPNSGLTQEEYSTLTDKEKAQLNNMQQQVQQLTMQNWQMQQKQQDVTLKQKYANYAPDIVDTSIHRLIKGEAQATREDIWKALDYENAVQRAYQLGIQDKQLTNTEKSQSMSIEGFQAIPQNEVPKINPGESNTAYFKRLANKRLAEFKGLNK